MDRRSSLLAMLLLAAAGFLVWAAFSLPLLTGRATISEAWDSTGYWTIGLPVLLALLVLVGVLVQERSWKLAASTVAGHFLGMFLIAKHGTDLALLPLTLLFVGAPMFVVFTAVAWVGGLLRRAFSPA